MRKLVWFFIILFVAILCLSLAAHFSPPLQDAIKGFLAATGGSIWMGFDSFGNWLRGIIGATNLNMLIAGLVIFGFGLISAATLHSLWQKHAPKVLGGKPTVQNLPYNPQTAPAMPESAPAKVVVPAKPEEEAAK